MSTGSLKPCSAHDSWELHAKPGDRVVFHKEFVNPTHYGGGGLLVSGMTYTIRGIEIGPFATWVALENVPGIFSSIIFAPYPNGLERAKEKVNAKA